MPAIFPSYSQDRFRSTSTSNRACFRLCRKQNVWRQWSAISKPFCLVCGGRRRRGGTETQPSAISCLNQLLLRADSRKLTAFFGGIIRIRLFPVGEVTMNVARTLGELRHSPFTAQRLASRRVKDELRENLMSRLREGGPMFPGIVGYDDTVVPQIVNAILSRHNFILLGLRGQAKSRILRALTALLDPQMPYVAGCEIHDNPYVPICRRCRELVAKEGDATPIAWLTPEHRYVEKLATPDVTIADLIGDIDPIKAARGGHELSSEFTVHYGLLPRANRGIFAINELPDLAGKIQVGLFNIMQEGDVQIKGYPIRLPLDVAIVFSANPEDYTARGKIITPLKDRIGSEIRTHYPATVEEGIAIT